MEDVIKIEELRGFVNEPLDRLIAAADRVRRAQSGAEMHLCSIMNAKSGLCSEDCKFCAQSCRHKTGIEAYPLKASNEIVDSAKRAKEMGAERFGIVTSGNRLSEKELDRIERSISLIKKEVGIKACASLGRLKKEELRRLKKSGLDRYHHNIETSFEYFPKVTSTHTFAERIETITAAKEAGLEVCSGGIIGLGESWSDRIKMAKILKVLDVDSVPINVLVPIKGTLMESVEAVTAVDVVRTIAIFRLILRDKTIKIAAGRETVLKDFQLMAFQAGANGMLIGGYLTVKGRLVEEDHALVREVRALWKI